MLRSVLRSTIRNVLRGTTGQEDGPLAFDLPLLNTLEPSKAQSSGSPAVRAANAANYSRATTGTSEDHQGKQVSVLSNEPRMKGSRRVENLITASEDMTNGAYIASNGGTVDSATQVTFDGTTDARVRQDFTITDDGSGAGGRTFVFSVYLSLDSGTISSDSSLELNLGGDAMTSTTIAIGDAITSSLQRFSVTASTDAAGTTISPYIYCDDAVTLTATKWQLEEVTGNITHAPSEYVSTGVGTGPELLAEDLNDWEEATPTRADYAYAAGQATITNDHSNGSSVGYGALSYSAGLVDGKDYVLEVNIVDVSHSAQVSYSTGPASGSTIIGTTSTTGVNTFRFTASGAKPYFNVLVNTAVDTAYVTFADGISIKEADHGLNRDGVKAFNYHNGNTVASTGVVTEAQGPAINSSTSQWVELDGASGTYVSSPDSASNSPTSVATLIAWIAPDDWTPSGGETILGKWNTSGNQRSWWFNIQSNGRIGLSTSSDGTSGAETASNSGVATGFSDGTGHWVRVTVDTSNNTADYYTSDDPIGTDPLSVSWTQLGTQQAHTASSIHDGTAPIEIAGIVNGTANLYAGKISRAVVIDSTDATATPVVDFNANDYDAGKTWTSSSTSEIWTLNGTARVFSPFAAWGVFPGNSGDFFSSPDKAAPTTDMSLAWWMAPDDWTPSSTLTPVSKWNSTGDQRAYSVDLNTNGTISLFTSSDGAAGTQTSSSSTVATGFANGTGHWIGISFDDTANTTNFWTSSDSPLTPYNQITWTRLGDADVTHSSAGIYDSTANFAVGSLAAGTTNNFVGYIARAAVFASTDLGANTAPSVDFDARTFTPGVTTATASTGEVWTQNGNCSIEQNIPSPWDASGPLGYLSEQAGTNVQPYSSDLTNAAWSHPRFTMTANNAIAPDGTKTGVLLTVNAASEPYLDNTAITISSGADQVTSWHVKDSSTGWVHMLAWDTSANGVRQWFNTTTGEFGTATAFGTGWSVEDKWVKRLPNGWWRISVRWGTTGTTFLHRIGLSPADNTLSTDDTGETMYVWEPQMEANQFPTSQISTGASSATRNADVLTYSAVGNADTFPMTVSAEYTTSQLENDGTIFNINDQTASNRVRALISASTNAVDVAVTDGGAAQAAFAGNDAVIGVTSQVTLAVTTNDVELYQDGLSTGTDASATMPDGLLDIDIGVNATGSGTFNGTIRNVKIFNKRLNDSQVATL